MTKENLPPQPNGFVPDEDSLHKQARLHSWRGLQGEALGMTEREAIEEYELGEFMQYALTERIENRLRRQHDLQPLKPPGDPLTGQ